VDVAERLGDLPAPDAHRLGRRAADLHVLLSHGIPVVDTAVVNPQLFARFLSGDSIGEEYATAVVRVLCQGEFTESSRVIMRCSLRREYRGLEDDIPCERTYVGVKHAVERIYRSWFGDRARAERIAQGIPDDGSAPAVLIQPVLEGVFSLVTRTGAGEPTNEANYRTHIGNSVHWFRPEFTDLLARIERVLKRPSEVCLAGRNEVRVYAVKDEQLGEAVHWEWLGEAHAQGLLDDVEYVARVRPGAVSEFWRYRFSEQMQGLVAGLVLAPGFGVGRLVLRSSDVQRVGNDPVVFVGTEVGPDDLSAILGSAGAIETGRLAGMRTGHLALICRRYGVPAIALPKAKADEESRRLVLPSGLEIGEFTWVMIDGGTGQLSSSDRNTVLVENRPCDGALAHLGKLREVLSAIDRSGRFHRLPLEVQSHIGLLKYRLRGIGELE